MEPGSIPPPPRRQDSAGQIIQVVTADQPAPTFVVDDSKLKASITTIFSLIVGGVTLFGSLLSLLRAGDIEGIQKLITSDTAIAWLAAIAPLAWIGYRTVRTWFKKDADIAIAKEARNAILKSEIPPAVATVSASTDAPTPTRAPETTTRLVGGDVLNSAVAGSEDHTRLTDAALVAPKTQPDQPVAPLVIDNGLVGDRVTLASPPTIAPASVETPATGDAPISPDQPRANDPEFDAAHTAWEQEWGGNTPHPDGTFTQYLTARGWTYVGGRWQQP